MPGSLGGSNSTKRIIDKYNLSRSYANLATHFDEKEAQNNYLILDYFGFYHPEGLTHRDKEVEHRYRKKDVKRVDKWMRFIQNNGFDSFYRGRPNEELIRRVFKGIPPPIRPRVWPILLNVASAKKHQVYEDMRKYAFASSTYIEQIDLDINRTFRTTTFFNEAFGPRQQVLFRILAAYSVYNSEVGYCQGMSDIAGMLLIYIMDEEEAFWALAQLLNGPRHKMHCLFVRDFPGLRRYFEHHDRVLRTHLHRLWKHFKKEQIDTCTYACKWFMQCFLGRLPISLTLRIWDIYLLEGEKAMVAMAYNILKMHKQKLLRMDQMQVFTFLQDEISRDFGFDDDDVIDSLKDCFEDLRKSHMETPPPLTPDMLPTKPMGVVPDVWQIRHEDDPKTVGDQGDKTQKSTSKRNETAGVLRTDTEQTSTTKTTSPQAAVVVKMRKPPTSAQSPHSTDSRRRLRTSQLSVTSSNSMATSPRISGENAPANGVTNKPNNLNTSQERTSAQSAKSRHRQHITESNLTVQSNRRVNSEKRDTEGGHEFENVWFIPPGTGYVSSSSSPPVTDHRKEVRSHHHRHRNKASPVPVSAHKILPRDYHKAAADPSDSDSASPWKTKKHTSASSNSNLAGIPGTYTKLGTADVYTTKPVQRPISKQIPPPTNDSNGPESDTRWSVRGRPPSDCSPLYVPPSSAQTHHRQS